MTRIPTQKRSIEKKNKIIEKGFYLMCNNGYFKTTTYDIAKEANVSTGIIYQYFNDKKDIFIAGIKNYSDKIMFPTIDILKKADLKNKNIENIISNIIDSFIKTHTLSKKEHEEIMALSHLDDDIEKIFLEKEINTTNRIVEELNNNGFILENAYEKVHIIMGIIENFCHEVVYHKHSSINYENMEKEVIKIVNNILKEDY